MKVSGSSEPSAGTSAYLAHEAVVGLQPFDDLLAGKTLRDRHLVGDRLALGDDIDNLPYAGCLRDQVVASLQLHRAAAFCPAGRLGRQIARNEKAPVGDNPVALQACRNLVGALAFRYRYLLALGKRARRLDLALQENGRPRCQEHDKQKEGENPAQEAHEPAGVGLVRG